jgi:cytochrome c oxidase subunit 2
MKTVAAFLAVSAPAARGAQQRMLSPGGPAARNLADLGWFVVLLSLAVLVVMWFLIGMVLTRPRGSFDEHAPADTGGGLNWVYFGGFAFPAIVLAIMYVASLHSMSEFPLNRGMNTPPDIRIIGHQWWWELQYLHGPVHDQFVTANEIHIPVGRPVDIDLTSDDVIHSFWVPELHGKVDLIPGQLNRIRIEASQPATYRGKCAEYCGAEHARMILLVEAQSPADYEKWLANARQPGRPPQTQQQIEGQQIFMSSACSLCHKIEGTLAAATLGPNLTHLASRRKIGANLLDNNTANLAAWVVHARSLKPAVIMPDITALNGDQLRALVAYLQNLR